MTGKVKWFDSKKGYGFITGENGKAVEFEVGSGAKGEQAVNVTVIE